MWTDRESLETRTEDIEITVENIEYGKIEYSGSTTLSSKILSAHKDFFSKMSSCFILKVIFKIQDED